MSDGLMTVLIITAIIVLFELKDIIKIVRKKVLKVESLSSVDIKIDELADRVDKIEKIIKQ
jgi:hypothetical protein